MRKLKGKKEKRKKLRVRAFFFLLSSFFFCWVLSCNGDPEDEGFPETWQDAQPLKEIYAGDFLMGNIISPGDLNNADRFGYLKRHYNPLPRKTI